MGKIRKLAAGVRLFFYHIFYHIVPVQKDMVVFESNLGRNYTGNPRAVYEEMVRQGLDSKWKLIYIMEDLSVQIPGKGKIVPRLRLAYYYYMAAAGVYVADTRMPKQIRKRKDCHYIQTWHGTPLKKLALDMTEVNMAKVSDIKTYQKDFLEEASNWDYLVSQNHFSSETFRRAFAFHKELLEIGYPRNDSLIRENNPDAVEGKKRKLGLPPGKKILLYAPTWRDDEYNSGGDYKFSSKLDFKMLQSALSEEYILIVKYHYLIRDSIDWSPYKGFIYDFDAGIDISELYLVSDALITDYSSVMFDYSILGRPMYFYVYDLEKYKNELRGFYFDLEKEAPGPVSRTTEELLSDIQQREGQRGKEKDFYERRYDAFREKYNHRDDGRAAQRLIAVITGLCR